MGDMQAMEKASRLMEQQPTDMHASGDGGVRYAPCSQWKVQRTQGTRLMSRIETTAKINGIPPRWHAPPPMSCVKPPMEKRAGRPHAFPSCSGRGMSRLAVDDEA